MSSSMTLDLPTGKLYGDQISVYCCAALTAPSTMTGHMQTGDILVSINGVSLISDSKQSESKGGSEAFFDMITSAIKHAKCPRKVRLLRPFRAKGASSPPKPSIFDIHLSASEASFLFDPNCKAHIPKFTVGKVAFGKFFESAGGSLFDVVFPTQTSLGIRIFPYKLIDSHTIAPTVGTSSGIAGTGSTSEEDVGDQNFTGSSAAVKLFENESRDEGDIVTSESDVMANIADLLSRIESKRNADSLSPGRSAHAPHSKEDSRRWSVDCGKIDRKGQLNSNAKRTGPSNDDDIVSDAGKISVNAYVSRLEASGDDYIPVSSPTGPGGDGNGHVENLFEEALREEKAARKGSQLAVDNMVAKYETSRKNTPPRSSSMLLRASPSRKSRVVALDDFVPSTPKPSRRSLPPRMTPSKDTFARSPSYLSPSTPSPTRRREREPSAGYNMDDLAIRGAVAVATEKVQADVKKLMKENENLKAKMGFMQCSVSIEKQLLHYELKGAKARLELSERELEESKIESKMNTIIMQDHLDNSIKDIVAVILSEKEELAQKLHAARNDIVSMEVRYNDKVEAITEENESIKSELDGRTIECAALTADILNLQAERDCMKSSTVMTDFRTRSTTKVQAKELLKLKETEKKFKAQILAFITDFDKTVLPSSAADETIEAFLSGRGLAINRNRRKHFAALIADNTRLYDDLDTMQELLEVEAALQFTRVELYTKSVQKTPDSAANTPNKAGVNILLNNENTAPRPSGRKSMDAMGSKRVEGFSQSRRMSTGNQRSSSIINIDTNPMNLVPYDVTTGKVKEKEKERERAPRVKRRSSSMEISDGKENEKSPLQESHSGNSDALNKNPSPKTAEMEKGKSKIRSLESNIRENNTEFLSPSRIVDSTMMDKSSPTTSPYMSVTPRKKNIITSPNNMTTPQAKTPTGFNSSSSKNANIFKGSRRPQCGHSPMGISDELFNTYPMNF